MAAARLARLTAGLTIGLVFAGFAAPAAAQVPTPPPLPPSAPQSSPWVIGDESQGPVVVEPPASPPLTPPPSSEEPQRPQPPGDARAGTVTVRSLNVGVARAGSRFTVRARVGVGASRRVAVSSVRCTARVGGRRLRSPDRSWRRGAASCAWRLPRRAAGKRLRGRIEVHTAAGVVARRFRVRVQSIGRSAPSGGPLLRGTLGCFPPDYAAGNAFFKLITANVPAVAAVDRTAATDTEYVWWVARLWENGGADVLNGSGWYPDPEWTGWQYTAADDAYYAQDWHNADGSVGGYWPWYRLEGQKVQAVQNWAYWTSTGAWVSWWSSDANGAPAYCSAQGYLGLFR